MAMTGKNTHSQSHFVEAHVFAKSKRYWKSVLIQKAYHPMAFALNQWYLQLGAHERKANVVSPDICVFLVSIIGHAP